MESLYPTQIPVQLFFIVVFSIFARNFHFFLIKVLCNVSVHWVFFNPKINIFLPQPQNIFVFQMSLHNQHAFQPNKQICSCQTTNTKKIYEELLQTCITETAQHANLKLFIIMSKSKTLLTCSLERKLNLFKKMLEKAIGVEVLWVWLQIEWRVWHKDDKMVWFGGILLGVGNGKLFPSVKRNVWV